MSKEIKPGVQSMIDKINNTEELTPEITLDNIINLMRTYTMEEGSMSLSEIFLIASDGKFSQVPIKPKDMRGDFGEMLMKKYISEIKKQDVEINSLVEMNFGHGIAVKVKKSEYEQQKERFDRIEQSFKEHGGEGLKEEPEYQDYFVVSIMTEKNIKTRIYDIIKGAGNDFVIADKPKIEETQKYDGTKLINFLK
jgi:translation elongation factor EF-1beta